MEGHEPCILITNQKIGKMSHYNFGRMVIEQYGCRWSIEELFRFQKQILDLENMRVRSITALRNFATIIYCLSALFPTLEFIYSKTRTMAKKLKDISLPVRSEVRFGFYRFAKGVQYVLQKRNVKPFSFGHYKKILPESDQLEFLYDLNGGTRVTLWLEIVRFINTLMSPP